MIRFETKPENAAAPVEKPKKASSPVEPVQLSLDPDAPEGEVAAKPSKRKSSLRSK